MHLSNRVSRLENRLSNLEHKAHVDRTVALQAEVHRLNRDLIQSGEIRGTLAAENDQLKADLAAAKNRADVAELSRRNQIEQIEQTHTFADQAARQNTDLELALGAQFGSYDAMLDHVKRLKTDLAATKKSEANYQEILASYQKQSAPAPDAELEEMAKWCDTAGTRCVDTDEVLRILPRIAIQLRAKKQPAPVPADAELERLAALADASANACTGNATSAALDWRAIAAALRSMQKHKIEWWCERDGKAAVRWNGHIVNGCENYDLAVGRLVRQWRHELGVEIIEKKINGGT